MEWYAPAVNSLLLQEIQEIIFLEDFIKLFAKAIERFWKGVEEECTFEKAPSNRGG